jgi:nitrogen regulatory protein PII
MDAVAPLETLPSERKQVAMKLIIAFIPPENLAWVQRALQEEEVHLMTVSEVVDCTRQQGSMEIYRGQKVRRPASKLRLEVAVADCDFDRAVEMIERTGGSGEIGEGKTFLMGLGECTRLCSCERDSVAAAV